MRKEVVAHKDPKSPISEVIRTLRTNIQFMSNSKKMKTLLITSTLPGEGKSWVTSNLAVTFAQTGKKIVLIDADMRKGRQYAIFGISPKPGLSNLLAEFDEETGKAEDILDYIQETEVDNLYVISAGNVPPNPSELLVSPQMAKVLEKLKDMCDIIIIDGTPCEIVTDSVILSRIVDTTVVVTAHKITKKDALQRVVKNIKNVGGNLAGVVINKVPISSKRYGEKYYYYGNDKNTRTKSSEKHKFVRKSSKLRQNERLKTQKNDEDMSYDTIDELDDKKTWSGNSERNLGYFDDNLNNIEKPKMLQRDSSFNNDNTSAEKTNDILNQINSYLEEEKKNLN